MRAHQLLAEIRHQYAGEGLTPTLLRVNFTRGQPIAEAFWIGPNGNGVGWQMQGTQWRLAMILGTLAGKGKESSDLRAAYAADQPWFNFGAFDSILGLPTLPATPTKAFNKFDPDFVHRYQKLPEGVTFEQLVDLAMTYGALAQKFTFIDIPKVT